MDGLVAPGSRRMRTPLLDLSQPKTPVVQPFSLPRGNVLDLRRPLATAPTALSAIAEAVLPIPAPIPARRPLPSLNWLVSGSAVAILAVGSVVTVPRILHKSANHVAKAEAAAPVAAAAAPTTPTPTSAETAAAQALSAETTALQSLVSQFAAGAGAPTYIVVKDLKTGATTSNAADQTLTSASLYKLFVAHGIYTLIDNGKLSLSSSVPGTGSNVEQCLTAMITVSDNNCGEALQTMLGIGKYDATMHQYGFTHTAFGPSPNQTSAGDVALLLERLYNGTLLGPTSTQHFVGLLKSQRINNRLPQGLPAGTVIAHKTGDLYGYLHDAGIVYGSKTDYLVVMMSGQWNNTGIGVSKFAELSSKLYGQLEQ